MSCTWREDGPNNERTAIKGEHDSKREGEGRREYSANLIRDFFDDRVRVTVPYLNTLSFDYPHCAIYLFLIIRTTSECVRRRHGRDMKT